MPRMSIVIALGLVLGAAFRLFYLDAQCLEMDELFTAESMYAASWGELFSAWILPDPHLPLYFSILKAWVGFFGDSEIQLRLPGAIFSVLALYASYALGKRVLRSQGALTIFVLLNAFSCSFIQYSQQARPYSLLYFGATLRAC